MKLFIYAIIIVLFIGSYASAQVVIVNKSVSESSISAANLGNIYSLTTSKWNNGSKIVVFDHSEGTEKTNFYKYIGKDPLSLKKEWMKKQLTGEAKAPETLGSDDEIISKVASTPGAVGYVKSAGGNSSIKVVAEIK